MPTEAPSTPLGDAAMLARLIRPEDDSPSVDAAESLLNIQFERRDLDRMRDLTTRDQDDPLSPAEKRETEDRRRVGHLLDLPHSQARRALKKRGPGR